MNKIILLSLILMFSCQVQGYSRKFTKIENCTSSGKTTNIDECQFKDSRFNFSLGVFKGSNQMNVS